MARPNNFWDVLSQTADYASEAIPAAQEQNRRTAQERERFGLRAQQEQERFGETKRYHNEMIGLGRDRLNAQRHPTEHPSFDQVYADILQHPDKYDPQVVKDFKDANAERHPGPREPKEPKLPDIIGNAQSGLRSDVAAWKQSRKPIFLGENEKYQKVYGPDPNTSPVPPTVDNPGIEGMPSRLEMARQQAEFNNLPADSIEYGLTGRPTGRFGQKPPQQSGSRNSYPVGPQGTQAKVGDDGKVRYYFPDGSFISEDEL